MKTVKLGDLKIDWKRGSGLRKSDIIDNGTNECVLYGELFTKYKTVHIDSKQLSRTNSSAGTISQAGDILVPGTSTAAKSEMIRARVLNEDGVLIGGDINIIRVPKDLFYPKYLAYFFDTKSAKKQLLPYVTGTTGIIHISNTGLKNLEVPLVSIDEQKKIVAGLDAAFERISAAEVLMRRNLDNVAALQKSILHKYLSASDSTHTHTLGDICSFVRGPFGGTLKKEYFKPEGYAVYEQRHAIYGMETPIRYFIDDKKFEEMKRFEVKAGDLLMSCSGTIGKISIVPNNVKQGVINQALLKFTPKKDILDLKYLKYLVESRGFQDAISERSGGSAIQNVASVKILKDIDVSIPSVDVQRRIVNQIESANQKTNGLHDKYQNKLTKLTDLRQSLLAEAFMTTSAV